MSKTARWLIAQSLTIKSLSKSWRRLLSNKKKTSKMKKMAYYVRTIAGEAIKARGKATAARERQRKECMKPLRLSNSDVDQL